MGQTDPQQTPHSANQGIGLVAWLAAVSPPRLPPLRRCLLPSYVSRITGALAVFPRFAREASLRRYAAVAGPCLTPFRVWHLSRGARAGTPC
jgi:hypothetical protein